MSDGDVRVLGEADWRAYRDLRLEALRESPDSFVASHEHESQLGEEFWREQLREVPHLVAERDGEAVGVVGLRLGRQDPPVGEVLGLWVAPQARGSRIAADLVWAAAARADAEGCDELYFWVGAENGAAVALASTLGFRPGDERRAVGPADDGTRPAEEVAMVLPLHADPGSVKNPWLP